MAASKSTISLSPAFSTILQGCGLDSLITRVDQIMAASTPPVVECTSRDCPIVGLHNTDECEELIAEYMEEGRR